MVQGKKPSPVSKGMAMCSMKGNPAKSVLENSCKLANKNLSTKFTYGVNKRNLQLYQQYIRKGWSLNVGKTVTKCYILNSSRNDRNSSHERNQRSPSTKK